MCKSDAYLASCVVAASKSDMTYTLGAVLVKGGKILSTGYNHHSSRHNGSDASKNTSLSMHAEMHAITNACRSVGTSSSRRAPADNALVRPAPRQVLPSNFERKPRTPRDPKSGRRIRPFTEGPKKIKRGGTVVAEQQYSTSAVAGTQSWVSEGGTPRCYQLPWQWVWRLGS
ncbi:hypothetical protein FRC03_002012 [Tulasnella sp. 419]|nr:hypothetical protein FRC03_002012 [Tulasnella sp. 419]